jgi:hypothetical protein
MMLSEQSEMMSPGVVSEMHGHDWMDEAGNHSVGDRQHSLMCAYQLVYAEPQATLQFRLASLHPDTHG